ncbi:MAG: hypothetical protein E6J13_16435 [Chloroflexi bacterium]|nr:MAG: hypothetical protein E6J13_16435 [Chloroflexota bacterium]
MMESVEAQRIQLGGWRLIVAAGAYLLGLVLVANLAFGTGTLSGRGASVPARTGGYDSRLPLVSPVDPATVGKAIIEAAGGPPTIGMPQPEPPTVANVTTTQPVAITPTTAPTYTAVTRTSTTANWSSLLSLIPSDLRFPPRASPHRG